MNLQEQNAPPGPSSLTPMMRQYMEHKARHPEAILLFRMGDFYEMFFEDAEAASRVLDIALTTRDKNKADGVPMCGFPHHAASAYITRLLAAGRKVAVCDQMEDPRKAKGIVRRDVTRVLTPGLTDEPGTLKGEENHFVAAVAVKGKMIGLAAFDLSTGDLMATETAEWESAHQELGRLQAKEVLIPEGLEEDPRMHAILDGPYYVNHIDDWMIEPRACLDIIRRQFGVGNLEGFGLSEKTPAGLAVGAMIHYVRQTRMDAPCHIKHPRVYHLGNYMVLDQGTIRNLELFRNIKDGGATGTLVRLLDKTAGLMGARMIRRWISYPLLDPVEIRRRNETVARLVEDTISRGKIREILGDIGDIERIAAKISLGTVSPRDLVQLRNSAERLPGIAETAGRLETDIGAEILQMDDLSYVAHAVATVIVDSPPAGIKDGGVIRPGYDEELDGLRSISTQGKEWIAGIEAQQRELTGIPNLRVGYNRVFGYYIEITKSHQNKVPDTYIRKQTLAGAERYITEELKDYELKVLNAQDRILELELELFGRLRTRLIEVIPRIQRTSSLIATLDVLAALAETAASKGYVRPEINEDGEIRVIDGRHPVVEALDEQETFVPNDCLLNRSSDQVLIITGPNMAGKSTYMRQAALIVIMAQIGSFVPAREASLCIVDRVFTRIGAADYLAQGQSTFMVEMNETADILNNATPRSLVILDEVGRGTSTFDGLSIAWAVTEYLHDRPGGGPMTLFATHYHELVDLGLTKERIKIYNILVKEADEDIVFLRKIVPGGSSRSYGIQVAKLAGIPPSVIKRAKRILANLEQQDIDPTGRPRYVVSRRSRAKPGDGAVQGELFGSGDSELLQQIRALDPEKMTPLEALNLLWEWKKRFS
ncbi:MAG: DNA mismatch repair protein MutS [Pseudomonadota bacterium]